jgi:hypothetical protein
VPGLDEAHKRVVLARALPRRGQQPPEELRYALRDLETLAGKVYERMDRLTTKYLNEEWPDEACGLGRLGTAAARFAAEHRRGIGRSDLARADWIWHLARREVPKPNDEGSTKPDPILAGAPRAERELRLAVASSSEAASELRDAHTLVASWLLRARRR